MIGIEATTLKILRDAIDGALDPRTLPERRTELLAVSLRIVDDAIAATPGPDPRTWRTFREDYAEHLAAKGGCA